MNNAKDIAEGHAKMSRLLDKAYKQGKSEALQDLKERVQELSDNPSKHMYDSAYLGALGDVIETVEDMTNE